MRTSSLKWRFAITLCLFLFSRVAFSQDDFTDSEELYFKKNTALTDFSKIGVNNKQYAKCLKNVNFLEPGNTMNITIVGKTEFRDDGRNYDLAADDGILTSTTLFLYDEGETVLPAGGIEMNKQEYLLHDEIFEHTGRFPIKFHISCKTKWVPCNQLPYPMSTVCNEMGPPYGLLVFYDCIVGLTIF